MADNAELLLKPANSCITVFFGSTCQILSTLQLYIFISVFISQLGYSSYVYGYGLLNYINFVFSDQNHRTEPIYFKMTLVEDICLLYEKMFQRNICLELNTFLLSVIF